MDYVEKIILNLILLLFPLVIYLLYGAYQRNRDKNEDSLFYSLALFSSLYLIMKYGSCNEVLDVLFHVPLLISYARRKKGTAVVISIILIIYYVLTFNSNFYFILLEYIIYYFIYLVIDKKKLSKNLVISIFLLIKTFFLSLKTFYISPISPYFWPNFLMIIINISLLYFVIQFIFILLKKGEEIIDLNQSLKELEREKVLKTSLFKIVHEVKNPIAVCKGYLDMLDYSDKDKLYKYIPIIKREIERTLVIMDDYSDFTKIKIEKDIMDLYLLLEDIKEQMNPLLSSKKIGAKFDIKDDELYIEADYNRLKQVLINIIKNAIEASCEEKDMEIELSIKERNNYIDIIIKDNGIGMDSDTLIHIYDMFYTTKRNGTGLGVGLSKEIIELHQGSINYESTLGMGTTVIITLPYKKPEE